MRSTQRDEAGSAGVLLCLALVVLLVVTAVGAVGGAYAVALHRTRAAADQAALAGSLVRSQGHDPCPAATRHVADDPATDVVSCRLVGDAYRYVVSVTVERDVATTLPGLPGAVRATAHAGTVPRTP